MPSHLKEYGSFGNEAATQKERGRGIGKNVMLRL